TGVEMAGAIAEIARYTLAKDFRHIDPSQARVVLVESEPRVLAAFPEDLQISAMRQLVDLGIEVRTGIHATNLSEQGLQVGDEFIPCRVKIWAAGNNASFVGHSLGAPIDRVGRVIVNKDLTIPDHPEVQVIGDLTNFSYQTGQPLPGVSPVAMQQGRHAARNILAMIDGRIPHRSGWLGHDRQLLRRKGRTVVKMKRRVQPAVPKITVRNLQRTVPVKVADLQRFAQKAAKLCLRLPRKSKMDLNELREISVLIVSDGQMASLHRQFMNESGPTDVITFQHGEIFISAETARRNAQRFGNALARELRLYV